jgi:cytochrome c-type biogenesis protein CcmF
VASLGTTVIAFAALFAAAAAGLAFSGGPPHRLRGAARLLAGSAWLLAAALALLASAFLARDLGLRYVAAHADRSMSDGYALIAVWAGQEGSLLLWAAMAAGACAAAFRADRVAADAARAAALGPAALVVCLLTAIAVVFADPFAPAPAGLTDGIGMSGLLRNPLMAAHPPALFAGFALAVPPAALAAAALWRGDEGALWIARARPWALGAWVFLGAGNLLGMLWAYEELGWGGYWGWDPVENASLLPWLASTAYLHLAGTATRGPLRRTAAVAAVVTAALPVFGTYLTRSGVVASRHAFSASPEALPFLLLLGVVLAPIAVGLARPRGDVPVARIGSLASREAAVFLTAVLLAVLLAAVTVATLAPLLTRPFGGAAVVEPPTYVRFGAPLAALLLALLAVCPPLRPGGTGGRTWLRASRIPAAAAVTALTLQLALGPAAGFPTHDGERLRWFSLLAFPLAAGIAAGTLAEILRAATRSIGRAADANVLRRIARPVAHIGTALLLLGFAGAEHGIRAERELVLPGAEGYGPGDERLVVGDVALTFVGTDAVSTGEYDEERARLRIDAAGAAPLLAVPSIRTYRSGPMPDTAEVSIAAGFARDVYVEMRELSGGFRGPDGTTRYARAWIRVHVNPLVFLVWAGGVLLIAGGCLALAPRASAERSASRRRSAGAVAAAAAAAAGLAGLLRGPPAGALALAAFLLLLGLVAGGVGVHEIASGPPGADDPPSRSP